MPALRFIRRAAWWSLALSACASRVPIDLPAPLALAGNETLVATLSARGVQIYECRSAAAGAAWALVAPEAELLDRDGRAAGTHGAGPHWQAADGSRVDGTLVARADAPAAGAIPWLLLETKSTGAPGRFERVTRVRRIHTAGGVAPSSGCDAASAGARARVPYTADYLFYTSY
jgi:hypothetical protein